MKKILIACLILLFSATAWAGYSPDTFISLHQPGGMKANWQPDGRASYRTFAAAKLSRFKLYIPAGASSANLLSHVNQGAGVKYGFIARLGQPPDLTTIPSDISFLPSSGFSLVSLAKNDCLGQASGGYVMFVKDSGIASFPAGAWLYVDLHVIKGGIIDTSSTVRVDPAIYKAWYDKATWNAQGDPLHGVAGSLPTVTPVPVPTPTTGPLPTATPLPQSTCNALACALQGGKCKGDVCVMPSATPTPAPMPATETYDIKLKKGDVIRITCE